MHYNTLKHQQQCAHVHVGFKIKDKKGVLFEENPINNVPNTSHVRVMNKQGDEWPVLKRFKGGMDEIY